MIGRLLGGEPLAEDVAGRSKCVSFGARSDYRSELYYGTNAACEATRLQEVASRDMIWGSRGSDQVHEQGAGW